MSHIIVSNKRKKGKERKDAIKCARICFSFFTRRKNLVGLTKFLEKYELILKNLIDIVRFLFKLVGKCLDNSALPSSW